MLYLQEVRQGIEDICWPRLQPLAVFRMAVRHVAQVQDGREHREDPKSNTQLGHYTPGLRNTPGPIFTKHDRVGTLIYDLFCLLNNNDQQSCSESLCEYVPRITEHRLHNNIQDTIPLYLLLSLASND